MPYRILVIDDHEVVREVISDILEMHGFEVVGAADGEAGMEMVQSHSPDLVLSDYYMPVASGLDVLHAIRDRPETADLPFILMSMEGESWLKDQALRQGANEFLLKPFGAKELVGVVRGFMGSSQGAYS